MTGDEAVSRARALFLDDRHQLGCMRQVEFVVRLFIGATGDDAWSRAVQEID